MEVCILCKESLCATDIGTDIVTIGDKGRQTLIAASIKRKDDLQNTLEEISVLRVHRYCRKTYTCPNTIISEKRKTSTNVAEEKAAPQLRSSSSVFDIKKDCIFCSESVTVEKKIPTKRRRLVSDVETIEFQETILNHAIKRQDDWGSAVIEHINLAVDLVAAEAKYHRSCAQTFLKDKVEKSAFVGRPIDEIREEAFQKLCEFLDNNDECQFSVHELLEHMETFLNGQDGYSIKFFKNKLKEHYGDDIVITSIAGKSSIVSFRDLTHKVLCEKWVTDKVTDVAAEKDRIIDMAASIILDDIRLSVYHSDEYPSMEETENGETLIPGSLKRFMHILLRHKGNSPNVTKRRCTAIAHSIIASCRPRSFISPLLLGIAVYIHRKYASRELIDILSSMCFADNYKEVERLEYALLSGEEPSYSLGGFTQFVFDNADFNVAKVTGHNTFHSLGGIACVTPPGNVERSPIKRTVKLPSAETIGTFGRIPIKTYIKPDVPGLQSVVMQPLTIPDNNLDALCIAAALNSLWVVGFRLELDPRPSWSGFMKMATKSDKYETTRIETLPFINLDPNSPSTIYSALCFAQKQCEKHGIETCLITFDQPLYLKAAEIVAANQHLDKIIVRLGGFHLLMSFLGSIGQIMAGSGLSELWETAYARGSVIHMMTGHAFSRALRAHILTLAALIIVLMEKPECVDNIDKDHLVKLYSSIFNQEQHNITDITGEECIVQLNQKISQLLDEAACQSRTGKLWVQYIRQVTILQYFIYAERTGNWMLHLYCIREMLPHFHAAGHLPYAKSARLYLQQMEALKETMLPEDYELFTEKGYFTIRRSDEFWGGNFSDQTIEQFLMRLFKTSGGMTHGRGITDSTLTKWVHSLPRCVPICNALEKFTGVHTGSSEQHKDLRLSSQERDKKDCAIFVQWLQAHPPFAGYKQDSLVSLSTGIVADISVNCDEAVSIGLVAASQMDGKRFTDVRLHRNDKVKAIGDKCKTVKVRGEKALINPSLLFNRITCVLNNSSEMGEFLAYELAPQPPSLFHKGMMRKTTKSTLGVLLKSFAIQLSSMPENCVFVIDGGHLLQTVVWPQPSTYDDICKSYISYTLKHYGTGSTVVFDGYDSTISTKVAEQQRRAQKYTSSDIIFDDCMPTTTTQAAFLANSNNKRRIIQMLSEKMFVAGIHVKKATADADALIVTTALTIAKSENLPVVVVGTDTDLLVMLVAQANPSTEVFMLCCKCPITLINILEIQKAIGDTSKHLMALHAVTGCDTVSALYRQGKRKAFKIFQRSPVSELLSAFSKNDSTHAEVESAGEKFILELYGGSEYDSLDVYREVAYKRAIGRSSLSSSFQLASLPPTSAAAKQHSFRTYHTVQEWMENPLPPTEWGWSKSQDNMLTPFETDRKPAPDTLLNLISCGCKEDGCSSMSCGCRKLGLFCTSMCTKCNGETCNNRIPAYPEEDPAPMLVTIEEEAN